MIGSLPYLVRTLMRELGAEPVTLASLPANLRRRYVDTKGQARIELFSHLDLSKEANLRRFVSDVRRVAPNATGAPVMLVDGGDAVVDAFLQATAISIALIVILLLIVLRDALDVILVVLPLGFAALLTVGTMRLFGLSFDLANIIALPLLIGLAIAFSIYLIMRWRRGMSVTEVLRTSTPKAVLFSALTTMSSFGSLAISSDPGMAILGETLTIALCAVIVAILVLQPALLFLRRPAPRAGDPARPVS
jgi:predicted RND superfamily exporter protein